MREGRSTLSSCGVGEKSTESIVDGETSKLMDHREHQTGTDIGVKGDKGCIKLLWAGDESRRDGR